MFMPWNNIMGSSVPKLQPLDGCGNVMTHSQALKYYSTMYIQWFRHENHVFKFMF